MIVDDSEEWEADRIANSKRLYRKLHHLVQWAGSRYIPTSWEPAEILANAEEIVDKLHHSRPRNPQ